MTTTKWWDEDFWPSWVHVGRTVEVEFADGTLRQGTLDADDFYSDDGDDLVIFYIDDGDRKIVLTQFDMKARFVDE